MSIETPQSSIEGNGFKVLTEQVYQGEVGVYTGGDEPLSFIAPAAETSMTVSSVSAVDAKPEPYRAETPIHRRTPVTEDGQKLMYWSSK